LIQGLCPINPLAILGAVHRILKINAPLDVEPEVGAVAEHARTGSVRSPPKTL
jgi:hypothetical protein